MRTNTKVLIMSKRVHFVVSRAPKSNKGESRGGRKQNGSKSKKRPWDVRAEGNMHAVVLIIYMHAFICIIKRSVFSCESSLAITLVPNQQVCLFDLTSVQLHPFLAVYSLSVIEVYRVMHPYLYMFIHHVCTQATVSDLSVHKLTRDELVRVCNLFYKFSFSA